MVRRIPTLRFVDAGEGGNQFALRAFQARTPGWRSERKRRLSTIEDKGRRNMSIPKNTICLWYDKDAEAAARFYAATFPDSKVGAVHRAPSDFPSGKKGDVL